MDACRKWRRCSSVLAACLWLLPVAVLAVEPQTAPPAGAEDGGSGPAGFGQAVADDALTQLRGGEATVLVGVDNQGQVGGNTATGVVSGDNRVDGGAFANAAGLSTVIQNSGANVLIQNGTAINVRFGDPGP